MAPVVEGRDLADDHQRRVGRPSWSWRYVGQSLDLADDVVAEVADEPAVHRWQFVDDRRAVRREHRLDRGEDSLVGGHVDAQVTVDGERGCQWSSVSPGVDGPRRRTGSSVRRSRPIPG